jgi:hypothetical protein
MLSYSSESKKALDNNESTNFSHQLTLYYKGNEICERHLRTLAAAIKALRIV